MRTGIERIVPGFAAALLFASGLAVAQGFPTKAIRIIVPYSPGGSTDVVFRLLAPRLSEDLGEINFGSAGNGSANHLATAKFMHATGTQLAHVPYKGGGPAVVSLVSGETSMLFATIPSAIQHIQAGRLRGLAVSRAKRSAALSDVPTVAEAGVPGYEAIEWNGVMLPAGTPPSVIRRVYQSLTKVLAIPAVGERIVGVGAEPVGSSPEEFSAFIRNELTTWARVIKEAGIRIE